MSAPPPTYVYFLGDHEENGTTNVVATLDRSKLPAMLASWLDEVAASSTETVRGWSPEWVAKRAQEMREYREECESRLARSLEKADADLAADGRPWRLSNGWGGVILTVARLI
ncbi:hypothetical protein MCBMB27_02607 [Methylobacterium phyllosphaerae]|uniref:Uncharacterized protein n=1 Tax=Methylobacterium phyllosphaerae TaxID=418223 RepID=A0AAE8HSK8_9HYPH|nr:hypothetical protein [Methylobacterium phyllosphaerae]APT31898.1 hypothetical protein MCBMB27_02607 [Methylobacterium phyllosphaerae]SFH01908.1 hypothetical protein SAMN05192567_11260 [Methylobacterium phyllosphaerae]